MIVWWSLVSLPLVVAGKTEFVSSPFDNFRIECPKGSGATSLVVKMVESVGAARQDVVFDLSCEDINEIYPWINEPQEVRNVEREDCYYSKMFDPIIDEKTVPTCRKREYLAGITRTSETRIQILCCRLRSRDEFNCGELTFNKPIGKSRTSIIENENMLINAISVAGMSYRVRFCDLSPRNTDEIFNDKGTTKKKFEATKKLLPVTITPTTTQGTTTRATPRQTVPISTRPPLRNVVFMKHETTVKVPQTVPSTDFSSTTQLPSTTEKEVLVPFIEDNVRSGEFTPSSDSLTPLRGPSSAEVEYFDAAPAEKVTPAGIEPIPAGNELARVRGIPQLQGKPIINGHGVLKSTDFLKEAEQETSSTKAVLTTRTSTVTQPTTTTSAEKKFSGNPLLNDYQDFFTADEEHDMPTMAPLPSTSAEVPTSTETKTSKAAILGTAAPTTRTALVHDNERTGPISSKNYTDIIRMIQEAKNEEDKVRLFQHSINKLLGHQAESPSTVASTPSTPPTDPVPIVDDISRLTFANVEFPQDPGSNRFIPVKSRISKDDLPLRGALGRENGDGNYLLLRPSADHAGQRRAPIRTMHPYVRGFNLETSSPTWTKMTESVLKHKLNKTGWRVYVATTPARSSTTATSTTASVQSPSKASSTTTPKTQSSTSTTTTTSSATTITSSSASSPIATTMAMPTKTSPQSTTTRTLPSTSTSFTLTRITLKNPDPLRLRKKLRLNSHEISDIVDMADYVDTHDPKHTNRGRRPAESRQDITAKPEIATGRRRKLSPMSDNAVFVDEDVAASPFDMEEKPLHVFQRKALKNKMTGRMIRRLKTVKDSAKQVDDKQIDAEQLKNIVKTHEIRRAPLRSMEPPLEQLSDKNAESEASVKSVVDGVSDKQTGNTDRKQQKDGQKTFVPQGGLALELPGMESLVAPSFDMLSKGQEQVDVLGQPTTELNVVDGQTHTTTQHTEASASVGSTAFSSTATSSTTAPSTTTTTVYEFSNFFHTRKPKRILRKEKILTFCTTESALRDEHGMVIACGGDTEWMPRRCPSNAGCFAADDSNFRICCPISQG